MAMADGAETVVAAARRLEAAGLNRGASGNVSLRMGAEMLITPSAVPSVDLEAGMVARMAIAGDGEWEGAWRPSSEWRFHRDLYRARANVAAVVHTHAPWCTVMAVARKPLPAVHYMMAAFGGPDVRLAGYARYGTEALSDAVLAAIEGRNACLMASHGMITVGTTMANALWLAEELEAMAHQYVHAALIGGAHVLTRAEVADAAEGFATYRPGA